MRGRLAALVSISLLACACTRSGNGYYGTTEPKHGPDEVWTNLGMEPETLDPGKASEAVGGAVIFNTFAGLTQPHPVTLAPMPDIAERWDISPDGTRYTFHLRQSRWSDGAPLTAADFVFAWRRVLEPQTASKYASFLYPLRYGEQLNRRALVVRGIGAADEQQVRALVAPLAPVEQVRIARELNAAFVIIGGDEAERPALRQRVIATLHGSRMQERFIEVLEMDASLVGVRAPDPQTLVVDLEAPLPYFLHLTKFYTAMPVPRHLLRRLESVGINPELWTRPEYIVSNGPFVVAEAKFRQYLLLRKNPRYWDAEHVRLQRVLMRMIESYNTTLNMYEAGELDSIGSSIALPAELMDTLRKQKDFHVAPWNSTNFYWLNTQVPPLDDVRVRTALRFAVDRPTLIAKVVRGGQVPTADFVPPGLGGYPGLGSPPFDPERARKLLREAGYGAEHPLPKLTLTYNTTELNKQIAEAVQAMWRSELGVDIEIENQEWNVFLKSLQSKSFQIARYGWIGDYPDPYTFLEVLGSHNGNNSSGWHSDAYDALLDQANRTQDMSRRQELLLDAERIAMDAAPIVPIYVYSRSELIKPYLMGHVINYEARHLFKHWWIDERWYHGVPSDRLPDGFPPEPVAAGVH